MEDRTAKMIFLLVVELFDKAFELNTIKSVFYKNKENYADTIKELGKRKDYYMKNCKNELLEYKNKNIV